ncbi:MAG: DUF4174 domain-containing protein [Paracoccaceae bacterium]
MKTLIRALLFITLPLSAMAEPVATPEGPIDASEVVLADLLYLNRAVIVFADSPNDPNFIRQMELLARDPAALAERDALLIVDTDPAARTEVRLKFRPRGFSLVLMEKDGAAAIRKPLPWELREITNAIDKFPLRRQEVLERNPAGR